MNRIVLFSGQMANGKNVAADYLANQWNKTRDLLDRLRRTAFGDAVKRVFMDAFGVDLRFVEEWKRQDAPPPGFHKNVRQSLMFIGDGFRQINPDVWVDTLFFNYHKINMAISDGRYLSEVAAVKKHKGVNVGVWRPGFENEIDHPSESQLKPAIDRCKERCPNGGPVEDSVFDYFLVNSGTLDDLYKDIDENLIPYLRKYWDESHAE